MKIVKPLDAAWLYVESRDTPMHVASLMVFSPPPGSGAAFLHRFITELRSRRDLCPPWNLRLVQGAFGRLLPQWEVDEAVDLDFHVRHSALPAPGGERELGVLVSRLHTHPLDFHRPLWEFHLIEGLEGGRFALYVKMHHSLVDGIGGMRLLQKALSVNPRQRRIDPPWAIPRGGGRKRGREDGDEVHSPLENLLRTARLQAQSMPEVIGHLRDLMRGRGDADVLPKAPFSAPASVFNTRITQQRRFGTQRYRMDHLKRIARANEVSFNDVVLAACSTALRRFLRESGALPRQSLTVGIPISVRASGDDSVGTAISFIVASLATDIADPRRRLRAIAASTQAGKAHLQSLPRAAFAQYTTLLMAPFILELLAGLGGRGRPMFNLTISNVPGTSRPLYYGGARMEALYPVSVLTHGQALNITCISYDGWLNFGFTACRDTLPHMQRLAVYTGEALDELESISGVPKKM
jgi:Diacylglycerol O-acyltransferase (EC 2.3.1.20)